MWWPTRLWTLGTERIRWHDRDVRTVHIQSVGQYRGPGGLSGIVDLWVSDDERALPYRARMKVAVGSVELELLPDRAQGAAVPHRRLGIVKRFASGEPSGDS